MNLEHYITQYYGVDLIAMVSTMLWVYLTGHKKRVAFLFGMFGSFMWMVLGVMIDSIGSIVANVVLICLNGWAFIKWGKA